MMSSEEEVETMALEDKALKAKTKRVRQRVDAGEPRNSYASIPNFSSRPPASLLQNHNGYIPTNNKMLSQLLGHPKEEGISTMFGEPDGRVNGTSPLSAFGMPIAPRTGIFLNGTGNEMMPPQLYMRSAESPSTSPVSAENTHLLRDILQGRKQSALPGDYNGGGSVSPTGLSPQHPGVVLGPLLKGNVPTSGCHASETLGGEGGEPSGAGSQLSARTPEKEETEDSESKASSRMSEQHEQDTGPLLSSPPAAPIPVSSPSPICSPNSLRPPSIPSSGGGVLTWTAVAPPNALEVKRARVENIVFNMLQGPGRSGTGSAAPGDPPAPVNGCKKRKLYQPQQHEVGRSLNGLEDEEEDDDEEEGQPVAKHKRNEKHSLKMKIRKMEQQLMALHQLITANSTDDDEETDPNNESIASDDRRQQSSPLVDTDGGEEPPKRQLPVPHNVYMPPKEHCISPRPTLNRVYQDVDPVHIFDEARRLVSEGEKTARENDMKPRMQESRQSCIVPPPSRVGTQNTSPDIEWLIDALKADLSSSVAQVVDSVVSSFVQRSNMAKVVSAETEPPKDLTLLSQMLDRKSPRAKVIDRVARVNGHGLVNQRTSPFSEVGPKPPFFCQPPLKPPTNPYYCSTPQQIPTVSIPQPFHSPIPGSLVPTSTPNSSVTMSMEMPEQTEAMSLVVTPKKKRHKVTDTRITPRAVSRVLGQDAETSPKYPLLGSAPPEQPPQALYPHHPPPPPLVPVTLPTSVAIPNPSLHQSEVFSGFHYDHPRLGHYGHEHSEEDSLLHNSSVHQSLLGSHGHRGSPDSMHYGHLQQDNGEGSDPGNSPAYESGVQMTSTLTPMHLRKAKLMFFYARYPSSAVLKMYFPDIKFNKNNTAQLVKWFSNFREFYYIQMEKYARQAMTEGVKSVEDLKVSNDSELLRVLNLHYNRNNHIEAPENFRSVVEQTLREFFRALLANKDTEQSWKKAIYKVIARMDDNVPEYFKSPNFLEQLE